MIPLNHRHTITELLYPYALNQQGEEIILSHSSAY